MVIKTTDTKAMSVADFKYSEMSAWFEPTKYPTATKTTTQIPAPMAV